MIVGTPRGRKEVMTLLNLKIELARADMTVKSFAEFMGFSEKTATNKLRGRTAFTYPEVEKIQRFLFPQFTMKYLFESTNGPNNGKSA